MKKLFKYYTIGLMTILSVSCQDQLRIDERQTSFDVNYFTYSRYQLTTAIVNISKNYGHSLLNERDGQAALYFMDCYSGDQISSYYSDFQSNWDMEGSNPYTNEFRTLAAIKELATNEGNMATVAAADILKCFVGGFLTEKYGDIPFSEAVEGRDGNLFPKFDSQKEVYEAIFKMLDEAVATLSEAGSKGLPADHDLLFSGDKSKWIKFANSLKFRLMVHSYEAFKSEGVDLSAQMQAIASGNNFMSSVDDNASITFPGTEEKDSWYLQTQWGTGNNFTEQKPTKYLIDQLRAFDDPRMYVIFAPVLSPLSNKADTVQEDVMINGYTYGITYYPAADANVEASWLVATGKDLNGNTIEVPYEMDARWLGTPTPATVQNIYGGDGLPGTNGFYDNRRLSGFSQLIAQTNDDRLRAVLMESSEMMFLLAEARKNGWISSGSVQEHYQNGIRLSFERWQIVDGSKPVSHEGAEEVVEDFDAYYSMPGVALDGSGADLDKIALQKWLSLLVTNHAEAFTELRRTQKPDFVYEVAPSYSPYSYPLRYTYPLDEESNNKENYNAAVASLDGGKDLPSARMWILK
ncbi:SusD/RagB family nutrient-binding outer membrane lipoprotein [Maribellus sp. CM-23]|uniref:SusD/RagB family nutrient-binding outer membrane lipoprotein n=1 Tax=Maribellus sp. CM-23 TaxID=2781026 RepID=UPI001F380B4F|nr:SusD/RagB family nutrient-binding outer membrane lipoprotein [Maribellus sp. CM-23]MCE4562824.1 SusD/RagB family nutrient-binding outer membrane lipoprotein [Maribellus sp. CM-23]